MEFNLFQTGLLFDCYFSVVTLLSGFSIVNGTHDLVHSLLFFSLRFRFTV